MKTKGIVFLVVLLAVGSASVAQANWYDNWYCRVISENCLSCCIHNEEACESAAANDTQRNACVDSEGTCLASCPTEGGSRCAPGADPGCGSSGIMTRRPPA